MKKEVENENSLLSDLYSFLSSSDESDKEIPIEKKDELKKEIEKLLLTENKPKTTSPKKVKKRESSSSNSDDQEKPVKPIKPKKSISKDSPKKTLVQGDDFKRLQKRQKDLAHHHLIIPKEKTRNMWLNTTAKRFTLVLSTLKIISPIEIEIDEINISQKPRKSKIKMVNSLTSFQHIQMIGLSIF